MAGSTAAGPATPKGGLIAALLGVKVLRELGHPRSAVVQQRGRGGMHRQRALATVEAIKARGFAVDAVLDPEPRRRRHHERRYRHGVVPVPPGPGAPRTPSVAKGLNPIEAAMQCLAAFKEVEARWNPPHATHPSATIPTRFNLGKIAGGEWASSVRTTCRVDFRFGIGPGRDRPRPGRGRGGYLRRRGGTARAARARHRIRGLHAPGCVVDRRARHATACGLPRASQRRAATGGGHHRHHRRAALRAGRRHSRHLLRPHRRSASMRSTSASRSPRCGASPRCMRFHRPVVRSPVADRQPDRRHPFEHQRRRPHRHRTAWASSSSASTARKKLNGFSVKMIRELSAAYTALEKTEDAWVSCAPRGALHRWPATRPARPLRARRERVAGGGHRPARAACQQAHQAGGGGGAGHHLHAGHRTDARRRHRGGRARLPLRNWRSSAASATGGATLRMMERAGWGNAMRYLLTGDEF